MIRMKTGGRQKGTPNKATGAITEILARTWTLEVTEEDWRKWRNHPDPHIAFEAFKLAQAYQYGKPAQNFALTDSAGQSFGIRFEVVGAQPGMFEEQARAMRLICGNGSQVTH